MSARVSQVSSRAVSSSKGAGRGTNSSSFCRSERADAMSAQLLRVRPGRERQELRPGAVGRAVGGKIGGG